MTDWFDFIAKVAWPFVALVGILILGPGGLLRRVLNDLSGNILKLTDAITDFKATADNLNGRIEGLKSSTGWVDGLNLQLAEIVGRLEVISADTQQLAIAEGSRVLDRSAGTESEPAAEAQLFGTAEEMMNDIRPRWTAFVERLRQRLGSDQFDARKIAEMAWKLTDGRRSNPISRETAELIGRLHSQMKRFNRLQSTKDEWLTHDVYAAFVNGIERAEAAL